MNHGYLSKPTYKTLLGEGGFGIVELHQCKPICNNNTCNKCFIVKKLTNGKPKNFINRFKKPNTQRIQKFYKEYEIGILLNHKNIRQTLELDKNLNCIIFENCRGIDLLDYANGYTKPNTRHLMSYFYQILDAVSYLHNMNIAHLDLKLENIILNTSTNVIKLIDFGEASFFKDKNDNKYLFNNLRGTLQYLPPEVIGSTGFYGDTTDIWCCGMILYNLFYNVHPWKIAKITDARYHSHYLDIYTTCKLNPFIFPKFTEYYTETEWRIIAYLFKTLLNPNYENRISINKTRSIFGLLNIESAHKQQNQQGRQDHQGRQGTL
jgi:serine/threonine protein kinase